MKKFLSVLFCFILATISLFSATFLTACSPSEPTIRDEILTPLSNDFLSRTKNVYHNINGKDVAVYGFYRDFQEQGNNPNFSQALLIYQCIKYKDKYPDRPVQITVQSFHLSIVFAACVDVSKPDYGHVKSLHYQDYTEDGYYRLSYLLVEAAKKGIEVTVIGQLDGGGSLQPEGYLGDISFVNYFNSHLNDNAYIADKKVSDFMTFGNCEWKSYGDKAAADMMHNKTCTVSNYIDNEGNEHGPAVWTGSINIDGVSYLEQNSNDTIQTAVVITDHEKLRQVIVNYTKLIASYCKQEDVVPFRNKAIGMVNEQTELILSGKEDQIPLDEQIIYLGSDNDSVFELYFTPFGGSFSTWDTINNPYAKYMSKLLASANEKHHVEFIWNNVKFNQSFELANLMVEVINEAFIKSNNKNSVLHLHLPGVDANYFNDLTIGSNVKYKSINSPILNYHTKDLQTSYVENGERQYVTILNSLNMHEGSTYHQTNTVLIIKENDSIGNNFYYEYALLTTPSLTEVLSRVSN